MVPAVEEDEGDTDERERGDCDRGPTSPALFARGDNDSLPSHWSSPSAVKLSAAVCFSERTPPAPTGDPLAMADIVGDSCMPSLLGAFSILTIGVCTVQDKDGRALLLVVVPAWNADRLTGVSGMIDCRDKLATSGFGNGAVTSPGTDGFAGDPLTPDGSPSCC